MSTQARIDEMFDDPNVTQGDLEREHSFQRGRDDRKEGKPASSANGAYLNGWYSPEKECYYVSDPEIYQRWLRVKGWASHSLKAQKPLRNIIQSRREHPLPGDGKVSEAHAPGKGRIMYASFPLNWIFSDPADCEPADIRDRLTRVRVIEEPA
jgi:hypothetical protein